jgi:hypothetical protein
MAGNVTAVLDSGFDAFQNLYDIKITYPKFVIDSDEAFISSTSVRALDFTPPNLSAGTYVVDYQTIQLTRLNAKITGAREFTITFRIDADYKILDKFMLWKHIFVDPSGESSINLGSLGDSASLFDEDQYGKIEATAYKSNVGTLTSNLSDLEPGATWKFGQVIVADVTPPSYTRGGTDASTFTVKFIFGKMVEPKGGTTNVTSASEPAEASI